MNIHSGSDMEVYTTAGKKERQTETQTIITGSSTSEYETVEQKTNENVMDYGIDYNINKSSSYITDNNDMNNFESDDSDNMNNSIQNESYDDVYTDNNIIVNTGVETEWGNETATTPVTLEQITFADIKKMVYELLDGFSVLKKLGKTDAEIQRMVEDEVRHYQADIIYQTQKDINEAENYNFIECVANDIQKFKIVIQNPIVAAIVKFPITSSQISMLYESLMQMIAKNNAMANREEQEDGIKENEQIEQLMEKVSHLENIIEHLQEEMQNILIAIRNEVSPESIIQDLESFKDALKMDLIDNLNREIEYLKEKITEIDTIYSQHEDEQETIVNFVNEKLTEFEEKLKESRGDIPDVVWQRLQEQLEQMREELEYTIEAKLENKIESKIQYAKPEPDKQYGRSERRQTSEQENEEQEMEEQETENEDAEESVGSQEQVQIEQVETKSNSIMDMLKDPKKLPYIIGGGAIIGFIIAKIFHVHI